MIPLMPSPGRPNTVSTPQSASRSTSRSDAILSIAPPSHLIRGGRGCLTGSRSWPSPRRRRHDRSHQAIAAPSAAAMSMSTTGAPPPTERSRPRRRAPNHPAGIAVRWIDSTGLRGLEQTDGVAIGLIILSGVALGVLTVSGWAASSPTATASASPRNPPKPRPTDADALTWVALAILVVVAALG